MLRSTVIGNRKETFAAESLGDNGCHGRRGGMTDRGVGEAPTSGRSPNVVRISIKYVCKH